MGKKRKLKKAMRKRELEEGAVAIVICGGKKCAPRAETRATVDEAKAYAAESGVAVEVVKCLHVCEKGPIAATFPKIRFHKHVGPAEADVLIDKLVDKLVARTATRSA